MLCLCSLSVSLSLSLLSAKNSLANNDGVVSGDELVTLTQQWFKNMVDQLDEDMKVWTVYCNTHFAWYVEDLTPVVLSLQKGGVPFFGPTLRADGVHQVAVPLTALAPHPIPVHLHSHLFAP